MRAVSVAEITSPQTCRMLLNWLVGRDEEGKIDWNRTWKLAKMAFKTVLNNT